tara:strand:- start:268 stop:696 length:429 start_codon:yes stop_codon:yes gene_type:complete
MIKYKLLCKGCELTFDSWFASSKEYEKLKRKNLLNCHNCNSLEVEKSLMAPKLISKTSNLDRAKKLHKFNHIKKTIKEYQNFIKNNFDYVGENFAYEARSIHYNKEKKKRSIYGKASKKDLKDLKDEGIVTQMIPWIEDKNN